MFNAQNLLIFRNLQDDEVFSHTSDEFKTAAKLIEKAEKLGLSGNIFRSYLIYLVAHEPNLVSETVELHGGRIGESLFKAFQHDIKILFSHEMPAFMEILNDYKPTVHNRIESLAELERKLSDLHDVAQISTHLIDYYKKYGYGDIAAYRAFKWDSEGNKLIGIKHFEKILLDKKNCLLKIHWLFLKTNPQITFYLSAHAARENLPASRRWLMNFIGTA